MSLLQEAAEYETQNWRTRLGAWRRQAAHESLLQLGKAIALILLMILLLDGARRDVSHGYASVVAVRPGATLQTASGKSAPAPSFIGQSYALGDTLVTDATGSVILAFADGSVVQLAPQSQLRLNQSDAFRNGRRTRSFQLTAGAVQVSAPAELETMILVPGTATLGVRRGAFAFDARQGFSAGNSAPLTRYAVRPSFLRGPERTLWWPLDTLLGRLGVMGQGTLLTTDSQRRDACLSVCVALQKALPDATNLPVGQPIPLESVGLTAESLSEGQRAVLGPHLFLERSGSNFLARVRARDSQGTLFTITARDIQMARKENL